MYLSLQKVTDPDTSLSESVAYYAARCGIDNRNSALPKDCSPRGCGGGGRRHRRTVHSRQRHLALHAPRKERRIGNVMLSNKPHRIPNDEERCDERKGSQRARELRQAFKGAALSDSEPKKGVSRAAAAAPTGRAAAAASAATAAGTA